MEIAFHQPLARLMIHVHYSSTSRNASSLGIMSVRRCPPRFMLRGNNRVLYNRTDIPPHRARKSSFLGGINWDNKLRSLPISECTTIGGRLLRDWTWTIIPIPMSRDIHLIRFFPARQFAIIDNRALRNRDCPPFFPFFVFFLDIRIGRRAPSWRSWPINSHCDEDPPDSSSKADAFVIPIVFY